jgi:hypothetical protein
MGLARHGPVRAIDPARMTQLQHDKPDFSDQKQGFQYEAKMT